MTLNFRAFGHWVLNLHRSAVLAGVLFLTLLGGTAQALDYAQGVFRVFSSFDRFTSTGTSFAITDDGTFVTNFHVVFDTDNNNATPQTLEIGYLDANGLPQFVPATVAWSDARNDLAILQADLPIDVTPFPLLRSDVNSITQIPLVPAAGKPVLAVGFPGVADTFSDESVASPELLIATVTSGVVGRVYQFSLRGATFGRVVVQHSAEINQGNSGGPLVDRCNRVIGINTLKPVAVLDSEQLNSQNSEIFTSTPDGVFWATHSNTLIEILENADVDFEIAEGSCVVETDAVSPIKSWMIWALGGAGAVVILLLIAILLRKKPGSDPEQNRRILSELVRRKLSNTDTAAPAGAGAMSSAASAQTKFERLQLQGENETVVTVTRNWLEKSDSGALVIGRAEDKADFVVDGLSVSRVHAQITHRDGAFWVEDMGSSNGTRHNGHRVNGALMIERGAELRFGDEVFNVTMS